MSRVVVASGGFERTAPRYVRYIAGGHPDNSDIVDVVIVKEKKNEENTDDNLVWKGKGSTEYPIKIKRTKKTGILSIIPGAKNKLKIWNDKSKSSVNKITYEPYKVDIKDKAGSVIYFTLITDQYERDYTITIKEDCEYEFRRVDDPSLSGSKKKRKKDKVAHDCPNQKESPQNDAIDYKYITSLLMGNSSKNGTSFSDFNMTITYISYSPMQVYIKANERFQDINTKEMENISFLFLISCIDMKKRTYMISMPTPPNDYLYHQKCFTWNISEDFNTLCQRCIKARISCVNGIFHIINNMDRDLDLIEESLKSNS